MKIPKEVQSILNKLEKAGFEAYIVGGCVRDFLIGREANDWDVATNAKPEEIQKIFSKSVYENKFGTVGVKTDSSDPGLKIIEVTTYRVDEKYSDKRHPDSVKFTAKLEDDLARRDFTINAMALEVGMESKKLKIRNKRNNPTHPPLNLRGGEEGLNKNSKFIILDSSLKILDPFDGQKDLNNKTIRAVGDANERFGEDALRMIRAVRFACQLDFEIEQETLAAIKKNAGWVQAIAKERIKEEFEKIIMSARPADGLELMRESGLLKYIVPELEKGVGVAQNRHHIFTIYEHNLLSLKFAGEKKFNLAVRLAALLHDIAKPQAKRGEGLESTFYNHDFIGARLAIRILERLKFPREIIDKVALLVRSHMFVYDIGVVTEAAIRRLLNRVGTENMADLVNLRIADRLGSGVPKAQPYRLRHFQYMVEKVQHDPISVKMLKINGNDMMTLLSISPGPKIGAMLDVLLAEVIEDPARNTKKYLEQRAKELDELDLSEIRKLAKQRIEDKKEEEDSEIKGKYWVK